LKAEQCTLGSAWPLFVVQRFTQDLQHAGFSAQPAHPVWLGYTATDDTRE